MKKVQYKIREIFPKIIKHIGKSIIVIHGARQVGKTTLIYSLQDYLKEKQHIKNNQIFYFDLEDFEFLDLCDSGYKNVLKYLEIKGANLKNKIYLFIDEIQYLNNPSSFLKLMYDHSDVNLIVSGSSSFAIKSKFKDSLVGRTIDFELFGLSFQEFLNFKNEKINLLKLNKKTPKTIQDKLKNLFTEYAIYGSYPKVVLEKNILIKEQIIKQIINTYIKKDIADFAQIRDIRKFNNLIMLLARQSSNLVNIQEISKILNLNRETLEKYIFILENTYIIKLLRPYSTSKEVEISKMPKIYFEDTGIRNILAFYDFPKLLDEALFENAFYMMLRKEIDIENLYFWRTKNEQEVDFVINKKGSLIPLELKLSFFKIRHSGLEAFSNKYNTKKTYIVSLDGKNIIYPWQVLKVL